MVRAHGVRNGGEGGGAAVGADALPAQMDPVPLCRPGARPMARGGSHDRPLGIERSLGRDPSPCKAEAARAAGAAARTARGDGGQRRSARERAVHVGARGARRFAARSAAFFRDLHRRPLEYARACCGETNRDQPPRRLVDVQPALYPRRRGARQNPPAAGGNLGRQQRRSQGALSDRPSGSCTASSRR